MSTLYSHAFAFFFLQSCFVFFNVFFVFLKMILVGLATGRAVVFYE